MSSTGASAAAAAAAAAAAVAAVAYSAEDSKVQAAAPAVDFKQIEKVRGSPRLQQYCILHAMVHSQGWSIPVIIGVASPPVHMFFFMIASPVKTPLICGTAVY